jgi:hypothetical protein
MEQDISPAAPAVTVVAVAAAVVVAAAAVELLKKKRKKNLKKKRWKLEVAVVTCLAAVMKGEVITKSNKLFLVRTTTGVYKRISKIWLLWLPVVNNIGVVFVLVVIPSVFLLELDVSDHLAIRWICT